MREVNGVGMATPEEVTVDVVAEMAEMDDKVGREEEKVAKVAMQTAVTEALMAVVGRLKTAETVGLASLMDLATAAGVD